MIKTTEAHPETNDQVRKGMSYIRFAPQTKKTFDSGYIDAEQYQDEFMTLMIRERNAERRHQSAIIEVA